MINRVISVKEFNPEGDDAEDIEAAGTCVLDYGGEEYSEITEQFMTTGRCGQINVDEIPAQQVNNLADTGNTKLNTLVGLSLIKTITNSCTASSITSSDCKCPVISISMVLQLEIAS